MRPKRTPTERQAAALTNRRARAAEKNKAKLEHSTSRNELIRLAQVIVDNPDVYGEPARKLLLVHVSTLRLARAKLGL